MFKENVDKFLKDLAVSRAWADDFACAIKTEEDFEAIKVVAGLKNNKGERLYDNFQLFQFLGENINAKVELAQKLLEESPDYSRDNYNMPVINYIIKSNLTDDEIDFVVKNPSEYV